MRLSLCLLLICADGAQAETVIAARTLRAQEILTAADIALSPAEIAGALTDPRAAIGMETKVAIYAGRPIARGHLGPPAVIERNAIVRLSYRVGPLTITTEGRALERAAAGDRVRVMNLSSRKIVTGQVSPDGTIFVASGGF